MSICSFNSIRWVRWFVLWAALGGALYGQVLPKSLLSPAPLPPPTQPAAAPVIPATPPDLTIPLPKIADRAEELDRLLREISKLVASTAELVGSHQKTKEQSDEIAVRTRDAEKLLTSTPNSLELQEEDRYWRVLTQEHTGQRKVLAARAASLQEKIQSLEAQQIQWQATLDAIEETKGIESLVDRIKQKLDEMRRVRAQAQEQLNLVLTLQNQISKEDQEATEVLARIEAAKEGLRSHVFEQDAHPLWAPRKQREADQPVASELHHAMNREFSGAGDFVQTEKLRLFALFAVFFLTLPAAVKLERAAGSGGWPEVPPEALLILQRPWALALLVALLSAIGRVSSAPVGVTFVVLLLYMIVVLRLLPPLINPGLFPFLWTLTALSFVEGLHVATQLSPLIRRDLFALIIFVALVAFSWLARPAKMRALQLAPRNLFWFVTGVRVGIAFLGASLLANILGFVSLSQILGFGTVLGGFMAAVVYCTARILTLILATLLCSPAFRSRPLNREAVRLWGKRVINFVGALLWFDSVFVLFTIHETAVEAVTQALAYPLGFGTVRITLGGVFSLLLIVLLGYAIARFIRYALQRIMLTRFSLQRGLPYAASKVVYYILIVLVFLAALANAGIELNKFTVITGALSVGVGFGLQNVVNNFASGLILLFERPIRVDDTVEVGGLVGTVRRIGARSSTIQTFQGAEVIVPNSNMIANQVINWTLSSPWRRVDVGVGVAYGSDPEQVIKLLLGVASGHAGVMRSPEPTAFFLGFGDSALNFELRFWAARQDIWFQLKSDVSVDIAKALKEAGIEIPFPQRDLHIRSVDASVRDAISPPTATTGPTG